MERKVGLIVFFFCFMMVSGIPADHKTLIYNAYISGDMHSWKKVIDLIQKQGNKSNDLILSQVNYQYGYIAWCIAENNKKEAGYYIGLAEKNLAILERNKFNLSMVYAYKAAIYGFKIGLNIFEAPFTGPKSLRNAERALKLDPENYFAHLQLGNIKYYMPAVFGGSVTDALQYFRKAQALLENSNNAVAGNWNYLQLLTLIAQTYAEAGYYHTAKRYYEIILNIEPGFLWVRDGLYPQLAEKLKQ